VGASAVMEHQCNFYNAQVGIDIATRYGRLRAGRMTSDRYLRFALQ
jgi:hypothetical protein